MHAHIIIFGYPNILYWHQNIFFGIRIIIFGTQTQTYLHSVFNSKIEEILSSMVIYLCQIYFTQNYSDIRSSLSLSLSLPKLYENRSLIKFIHRIEYISRILSVHSDFAWSNILIQIDSNSRESIFFFLDFIRKDNKKCCSVVQRTL